VLACGLDLNLTFEGVMLVWVPIKISGILILLSNLNLITLDLYIFGVN
jgi:hypothetical protein